MLSLVVVIAVAVIINSSPSLADTYTFPSTFKIGAATASYQIEGAWNEDGKSPNIWDTLTHSNPDFIFDRSNGDVAADSYHLYEKDLDALTYIGFEVYRFSISWSRIIPNGARVNKAGIDYYNKVIDGLIARGIEPLVTMFHWDLPQYLQDLGGWPNRLIVDYYRVYADTLFEHFGDRVKRWITFNEPSVFCGEGYGYGSHAPAIQSSGIGGDYMCAHNVLLSHAAAYHLYKEKYFDQQQGQVGICLNSGFNYPYDETIDASVTDRAQQFELGKFAHPIFTEEGGYPQVMIDLIGAKSQAEGRPWSRLPTFTDEEKDSLRRTSDFFALNYYTSRLTLPRDEDPNVPISWWADTNIDSPVDPSWNRAKSSWLFSVPQGLQDLLNWIKDNYNNPTVLITENGWSDDGEMDDESGRILYIRGHLAAVSRAIDDGCDIVAYTVWSLCDNFEWARGFTERFGIHYVDFDSADKDRLMKKSAEFFKDLMVTKTFDYDKEHPVWG